MILAIAEGLGRRIAVDFGFGTFLEKIEEHFGKRTLKCLLILIGLSVALFCGKMIWDIALGPLVAFVVSTIATGSWIKALIKAFWTALAFAAGIGLASLLSANLLSWRQVKKGQELMDRTDALSARVKESMAETRELLDKAEAATGASVFVLEQANALRAEASRLVEEAKAARPSDPPLA